MQVPSASISLTTPTAALTVSASASLLTGFTANGPVSAAGDGDLSVQPDFANNRVLVHKPGLYKFTFTAEVYADGEQPATFSLYANGVAIADLGASMTGTFGIESKTETISLTGTYQAVFAQGSTTDAISVYITSADYNGNSEEITVNSAYLLVERIG